MFYRIQVEYFSSSTNCTWRPIEQFVAPRSCDDLTTTYFQTEQLTARLLDNTLYIKLFVYDMYINSTWTRVTLPLPPEAFTASTQFRWTGQENCPTCQFSLDDGMYNL